MKTKLIALICFAFLSLKLGAQVEYRTLKKLNDTTFVVTKTTDTEDAETLSAEEALSNLLRLIDNYDRLENKRYQQQIRISQIGNALRRDLSTLFPDTSHLDYIRRYDSLYSAPAPDGIYASQLVVRGAVDSLMYLSVFRSPNGMQFFRVQSDTTNSAYPLRFIDAGYTLRLGNNAKPLPVIGKAIQLRVIDIPNERGRFKSFYAILDDNTRVRLRLKTR